MRVILLLLIFPLVAADQSSDLQLAYQFYRQGDYSKSLRISDHYLRSNPHGKESAKLLYIYVTSETSLYRINLRLDEFLRHHQNSRLVSLAIYRTMERALVLGNLTIGKKWGEFFKTHASVYDFYGKGLFLYASILHSSRDKEELLKLLEFSLKHQLDSFSRKRLLRLKKIYQS